MRRLARALAGCAALAGGTAPATAEAPQVEHQPAQCAVAERPLALCATISDDRQVARARLYFRAQGAPYFYEVDMAFAGLSYCATLPALRAGQARALEYYVQAIDDEFQPQRTPVYRLPVAAQSACEFPPVADVRPGAALTIRATHRKQGHTVPKYLEPAGLTVIGVRP
jgi:hypothetical protein